jgi:AcrR family transcriptional regulator
VSNNEERLARRRQAILDAAERAFGAHGYSATTIDAVAEEAGISKGSIYNYFQGKEDLFVQVFTRVADTGHGDVQRLIDSDLPAADKIDALVDYWSGQMGHYQRIGRLVLEFWASAARGQQEGSLAGTFHEMHTRQRELIGAILAQGVAEGRFSGEVNRPVAESLILAILDGILIQSILDVGITVDEALLTGLKRAIRAGLGAAPEPPGPDRSA